MAELVKSDVVSMDWEKKGFYKIKGRFYFASKEYENKDGVTVAVFFTPTDAFLFGDNGEGCDIDDLWGVNNLVPWAHEEGLDGSFPCLFDEFIPVVGNDGELRTDILETYGIEAHGSDILKRLEDIAKFGELKEKSL